MSQNVDVFISYKREERALTDAVIKALHKAGYTAVTDLNISKNEDFSDSIDAMIRSARMTLVLWTKASAQSLWVRREARRALDLEKSGTGNKYLGVMLEDVALDLPLDLSGLQMLPLYPEGLNETSIKKIVQDVESVLGPKNKTATVARAQSQTISDELQFYNQVRTLNIAEGYARYITLYPDGTFLEHAKSQHSLARRWYLHPFRRGNLSNTIAFFSTLCTIILGALTLVQESRPMDGIDPKIHASVVDKLAEIEKLLVAAKIIECDADGKTGIVIPELVRCIATDVTALDLSKTRLSELTPLSRLTNLRKLDVDSTEISDLSPLSQLTGLNWLDIDGTNVTDLSPLSELINLNWLDIDGTEVSDLSPLLGLTKLNTLDIGGTEATDLSPLSALSQLEIFRDPSNKQHEGKSDVQEAINNWSP